MLRWCKKAADHFGGFLFVSLFVVFIVQVVARFVFNKPLPWTDELAVVLYEIGRASCRERVYSSV